MTLASEVDKHGLPVANFSYSMCDNDKQLIAAAQSKMEQILRAAGATETMTIQRFAHLVGGCRMATSAEDGVVDAQPAHVRGTQPLHHRRQRAADAGRRPIRR